MLSRRKKLAEQAGQQLTVLGLKLNEVTGYKEVERLKELVGEKGEFSNFSLPTMLIPYQRLNCAGCGKIPRRQRRNTSEQ